MRKLKKLGPLKKHVGFDFENSSENLKSGKVIIYGKNNDLLLPFVCTRTNLRKERNNSSVDGNFIRGLRIW